MTGMMMTRTSISATDLLEQGFSEAQISRLEALRRIGPYLEFVDDARQWKRLCFVKWLYEGGQLNEGAMRA